MFICWVEDDDAPYDTFIATLESAGKKDLFKIQRFNDFDEASQSLQYYNYSLLILDLRDGDDGERKGDNVLREIFENSFKPTIIYSAVEPNEVGNDDPRKHPLVNYIQKKAGSDLVLLEELEKLKDKISFLENVKSTIDNINFQLLKNTFPVVVEDDLPLDVMERLFARRIAASLDFAFHLAEGTLIDPCEMYLYPPLPGTDLLTGDIIKNKNDGTYFVILSPSCDMAQLGGRNPKIPNVLVAQLDEIKPILEETDFFRGKTDHKKLGDEIKKQRDKEPREGRIYLPRLNKTLPGFRVNLKKLSLIAIKQVSLEEKIVDKDFYRISSLDSPFRESFSTLAGQEMGRFGLPDFDYEKWGSGYWQVHPKKPDDAVVTAQEVTSNLKKEAVKDNKK